MPDEMDWPVAEVGLPELPPTRAEYKMIALNVREGDLETIQGVLWEAKARADVRLRAQETTANRSKPGGTLHRLAMSKVHNIRHEIDAIERLAKEIAPHV